MGNIQYNLDEAFTPPDVLNLDWSDAERIGKYYILMDGEYKRIFPKNERTGETIPVQVYKDYVHLKHIGGGVVTFARYRHQGKWFYGDSREEKSVPRDHIVKSISRMLFNGDEDRASEFIYEYLEGGDYSGTAHLQ